jgi:hypothetical protein
LIEKKNEFFEFYRKRAGKEERKLERKSENKKKDTM